MLCGKNKFIPIGILGFFLISAGIRARETQSGNPQPISPEIQIHMEANPKAATVGDPIGLDLDITMPAGYQVDIPKPVAQTGDFFIMDFSSSSVPPVTGQPQDPAKSARPQAGISIHHRAHITLAVYKTGKFVFSSIPLKIKTADGKEIAISSPPAEIEIRSVLTEKNPSLKDLKKQAEIPEPTRWLLWILLGGCGCALCLIAWYFWRRRKRQPAPLTPAQSQDLLEIAEADLRNLLALGLPDSGMEKQFYVALAEIVKRILEAGYGIHTAEQTTAEIMDALGEKPVPGTEEKAQIESFLVRCDVVKFAKYVPTRMEHESASQDALRILAQARKAVGS